MRWIAGSIKWIMLISGVLTCTMIYPVISPQQSLVSMFGETLEGPLSQIVVRNWGALIALVGAMLIYGAFSPANRRLVLVVAGLSKTIFIGLVLLFGRNYLGHQVGVAVVADTIMVILFLAYLLNRSED